jgi:phosphoenolpyruvate---glycerone phosphotransferase subunit DhaL
MLMSREEMSHEALRLDDRCKKALIAAVAERVIAHAEELTRLDQAIGDGDHGYNMKRGAEAVLKDLEALAAMKVPELLKSIGMKLVTTVGGASGPLYGTLFLSLGKQLSPEPSRSEVVLGFGDAIAAVKARGKSEVGQKTMLDVLVPVQEALAQGASPSRVSEIAMQAAQDTVPMKATRGRASFLGERSVGHMDPGARSSALMIAALCDRYGGS